MRCGRYVSVRRQGTTFCTRAILLIAVFGGTSRYHLAVHWGILRYLAVSCGNLQVSKRYLNGVLRVIMVMLRYSIVYCDVLWHIAVAYGIPRFFCRAICCGIVQERSTGDTACSDVFWCNVVYYGGPRQDTQYLAVYCCCCWCTSLR